MTERPFLFISARPEVEAVGPEYESVRRASGLDGARLEHLRLDADGLERVDPAAFAGVIVGGSPFNVTTPWERQATRAASASRPSSHSSPSWRSRRTFPLLFTCYGIGVLTQVLGGTVGTLHGEEASGGRDRAHRGGHGRPARRGAARTIRRARRAQGGHRAPARRRRAARLVGRLPGADLPRRRSRVRHPVPPRGLDQRLHRPRQVYRHHGYFPASELARSANDWLRHPSPNRSACCDGSSSSPTALTRRQRTTRDATHGDASRHAMAAQALLRLPAGDETVDQQHDDRPGDGDEPRAEVPELGECRDRRSGRRSSRRAERPRRRAAG